MNYLVRHWRGEVTVGQAAWLSSLIAIAVSLPVNWLEFRQFVSVNGLTDTGDLANRLLQDGGSTLVMPSFGLQLADQIVGTLGLVWWGVGSWRAITRDRAATGRRHLGLWATLVFSILYEIYDLYDFVSGLR